MFRYIGNKSKLLPEIIRSTQGLIGNHGIVADIMAGTGSVSLEYRKHGYRVIAADMMTYSKHHLAAQLLFRAPPVLNGLQSEMMGNNTNYDSVLHFLNALPPIEGYFFNEFSPEGTPANGTGSRRYFTSENACKIDSIREKINRWIIGGTVTGKEASLLKHTLIMAVNRVANISGTYGYYLSNFRKNALMPIELIPFSFEPDENIDHVVLHGFAEELCGAITADLCYIDPPYMKRQYAANYHILETLARGDFPEAIGKSGLRDWWDQHSKFCTKTKSIQSFRKVIGEMDCPVFLISYSEDGLIPVERLVAEFETFGHVTVRDIEYNRFRSNQSPLPREIQEYLITVIKA
jgi:adenine-specific DNA-methyltransferase